MFKDKNTLFYHKMMNLCLNYTRKELLKMYPTITKSEGKVAESFKKKKIDYVLHEL
jgi:hypothetical protein